MELKITCVGNKLTVESKYTRITYLLGGRGGAGDGWVVGSECGHIWAGCGERGGGRKHEDLHVRELGGRGMGDWVESGMCMLVLGGRQHGAGNTRGLTCWGGQGLGGRVLRLGASWRGYAKAGCWGTGWVVSVCLGVVGVGASGCGYACAGYEVTERKKRKKKKTPHNLPVRGTRSGG